MAASFGAGNTVGTVTSYSTGSVAVDAGTQTFSEIDFAGYTEGSWSCSPTAATSTAYDNGSVEVGNGETITCEITNTEVAPPMGTQTAYAKGAGVSSCFIPDFSQWGWANGTINEGVYVWDMYAGAADCDTSKGTHVGTVTVALRRRHGDRGDQPVPRLHAGEPAHLRRIHRVSGEEWPADGGGGTVLHHAGSGRTDLRDRPRRGGRVPGVRCRIGPGEVSFPA